MYAVSSSIYHKQILIQYGEGEYKVIPILTSNTVTLGETSRVCKESVFHYALSNAPYSVNKLAGLEADLGTVALWES